MSRARLVPLALLAALPACTALLGLPDPIVDPGFEGGSPQDSGSGVDGAAPDTGPLPDGAVPDTGSDGGMVVDAGDSGCSKCTDTIATITNPLYIDTDGTTVWVTGGATTIHAITVNTKADQTILSGQFNLHELRHANGYLYFTNFDINGSNNSASRCKTDGTGKLNYFMGSTQDTFGIATDGTANVWTTWNEANGGVQKSAIASAGSAPYASAPLAANIIYDTSKLYWVTGSGITICTVGVSSCSGTSSANINGVVDLAVGGGFLWYTDGLNLWRANLNGSSPMQFAQGQSGAAAVRADTQYVYWINQPLMGTGTLQRCPIAGPCNSPESLLVNLQGGFGLALSLDSAYVSERLGNKVWRVFK